MAMFFRQENKRPFNFSYIQERKQSPNYSGWIIGTILLLVVTLALYLLLT